MVVVDARMFWQMMQWFVVAAKVGPNESVQQGPDGRWYLVQHFSEETGDG